MYEANDELYDSLRSMTITTQETFVYQIIIAQSYVVVLHYILGDNLTVKVKFK